jgi:hypothetical protein
MTFEEKQAHPWNSKHGDLQCPFVTPHGDDGFLNCTWKAGHPADLPHSTAYSERDPEPERVWMLEKEWRDAL